MDKPKRKGIGKTTRFNVFKRDLFTCQYCSAKPPKVPLEIDHIIPVSKGGTNSISNLVTSCFDCNRGKGSSELTLVPESLNLRIENKAIAQKQYKEYLKLIETERLQIEQSINLVESVYSNFEEGWEFTEAFRITVKKFIDALGIEETIDSMEVACFRVRNSRDVLRYFCGVCWNKIKG